MSAAEVLYTLAVRPAALFFDAGRALFCRFSFGTGPATAAVIPTITFLFSFFKTHTPFLLSGNCSDCFFLFQYALFRRQNGISE